MVEFEQVICLDAFLLYLRVLQINIACHGSHLRNAEGSGGFSHHELPVFHVLTTGIVLLHGEIDGSVFLFVLDTYQRVGDLVSELCSKVSAHLALVVILRARVHVQCVPDTYLPLLCECHEVGDQCAAGFVVVEVADDVANTVNEYSIRI